MIVVVDYNMGNLGSILNMFKKIRVPAIRSSDPSVIAAADKLILPGVGAFDQGMRNLETLNLLAPLHDAVLNRGTPVLGICLGMQLLGRRSEEGQCPGLNWIEADTVRFRFSPESRRCIPHMGWNTVKTPRTSDLFCGLESAARFYFVHSYHVVCDREEHTVGLTDYGFPFISAVQKQNIYGTQFHPEKSHRFGLTLLQNFAERACRAERQAPLNIPDLRAA